MARSNSFPGDDTKTGPPNSCKMTQEERAVLAWERIADELMLLNQSFEHFLDRRSGASSTPPGGGPVDHRRTDSDFSSAPALAQPSTADHERGDPSAENFSVAGHNYPNLQRAFKEPPRPPRVATDEKGDA